MVNIAKMYVRGEAPVRGTVILEGPVDELRRVGAKLAKVSETSPLPVFEKEPGFGSLEVCISELNELFTAIGSGKYVVRKP